MAKRRVNKSAKVREFLLSHPDQPPRRVAEALKKLKITPQYVSSIKLQMKKEGTFPPTSTAPSATVAPLERVADETGDIEGTMVGEMVDVQAVLEAVRLIRRCGTLEEAHRTLDQANHLAAALHGI